MGIGSNGLGEADRPELTSDVAALLSKGEGTI